MSKRNLTTIPTYRASFTEQMTAEHMDSIIAKETRIVNVGDGAVISIRKQAGLKRHSLPIMLPAHDNRNTFDKHLFLLDTFGLKDYEADFMYNATLLSAIWEDPTINESFNSVNRLASSLYVRWLAGSYIRQFGLEFSDGDAVKVVTALYWYLNGETIDHAELSGERIHKLMAQVADASGVPIKDVKGFIDNDILKDKETIDWNWYMRTLQEVSDVLKYRLNAVTALSIASNSWYRGMAAQPQLATQYRPFFISMLYTAFNDRSASRTGIDTLIKSTLEGSRRMQAETFVRAIDGIMRMALSK